MSKGAQIHLNRTKNILNPTEYVNALLNECTDWAFNEEEALLFKGYWREKVFNTSGDTFLNLEVGPGNGLHFSHICQKHPEQMFLAVELKIQTPYTNCKAAEKTAVNQWPRSSLQCDSFGSPF